MRKWIGLLLMCMLLFCAGALADQSGTCGESLTWALTDDGVLTISGSGRMENYSYGGPWGRDINKVSLPKGLLSIGNAAFYYCQSLSEISIP